MQSEDQDNPCEEQLGSNTTFETPRLRSSAVNPGFPDPAR